jgi:tetratricopeptide (TPR) repeat protein
MNELWRTNRIVSRLGRTAIFALFIPCQTALAQSNFDITPDVDQLLRSGLHEMYDHHLVDAGKKFDELVRRFPDHPVGYVYKAELTWWEALQDRKNPALQDAFDRLTEEAISRGHALAKENPKDFYALLYLAAAYGNKTRYRGGIKRAYLDALQSGLKGHAYIKEAAGIRPENIDCLIGIGSYNYFAGALPSMVKPFSWMFGVRGDKDEGIRQLALAAQKGEYGQTEAKIVLLLVYFNEPRFEDYQKTLTSLIDQYPSNPVFYMWMADFFVVRKKASEGVQFFTDLIDRAPKTSSGEIDPSAAHYEKGRLQMEEKNWDAAIASMTKVIEMRPLDTKLTARAHLLRGLALDLKGQRSEAVLNYQAVLRLPNIEDSHERAKRCLKSPYRGTS